MTTVPLSLSAATAQRAESLFRVIRPLSHESPQQEFSVLRNRHLRSSGLVEMRGADVAIPTACVWRRGAPRPVLHSARSVLKASLVMEWAFPTRRGDFYYYYRLLSVLQKLGGEKEKGLITNAIYQTTLVKILHFKTP